MFEHKIPTALYISLRVIMYGVQRMHDALWIRDM